MIHRMLDEGRCLGLLLHMCFHKERLAAAGLNLGCDALAPLDVTIGKGNLRSLGDKASHRCLANA